MNFVHFSDNHADVSSEAQLLEALVSEDPREIFEINLAQNPCLNISLQLCQPRVYLLSITALYQNYIVISAHAKTGVFGWAPSAISSQQNTFKNIRLGRSRLGGTEC